MATNFAKMLCDKNSYKELVATKLARVRSDNNGCNIKLRGVTTYHLDKDIFVDTHSNDPFILSHTTSLVVSKFVHESNPVPT